MRPFALFTGALKEYIDQGIDDLEDLANEREEDNEDRED